MLKKITALVLCVLFCFVPTSTMVLAAENTAFCTLCDHPEDSHGFQEMVWKKESYNGSSPTYCYRAYTAELYKCKVSGCDCSVTVSQSYEDMPHTFVNSPTCSVCRAYTHP